MPRRVVLAHYSLDGARVHDVQVNGLPIIRPTADEATVRALFDETCRAAQDEGHLVSAAEWDGDLGRHIVEEHILPKR